MTAAKSVAPELGIGLYTIPQAAQLIGEPYQKVRRWTRPEEELVPRTLGDDDLLTFSELMELHFIKMFRDQDVSLQTIKAASAKAAQRFHSKCPFSVKRFDTDGRSIFATLRDETTNSEHLEDIAKGQLVFQKIMKPFFRKLEYGKNFDLLRFWPMSKNGRVVIDPERHFGQPIDAETGVPTHAIVSALKAGGGQSPAVVARWLDIPLAAVNKAAQFERSLAL